MIAPGAVVPSRVAFLERKPRGYRIVRAPRVCFWVSCLVGLLFMWGGLEHLLYPGL